MSRHAHWWKGYLEDNGLRRTPAREAILSVLSRNDEHLSAEDIYLAVHSGAPKIGLTTVYRTLNTLSHRGLVCKLDFGDGRARFELTEKPGRPTHHHHLICMSCGTVYDYTDFAFEELDLIRKTEKSLSQRYNFTIRSHMIQFQGLCEKCRSTV